MAYRPSRNTPPITSAERLATKIAQLGLSRAVVKRLMTRVADGPPLRADYRRAAQIRSRGLSITYWSRTAEG